MLGIKSKIKNFKIITAIALTVAFVAASLFVTGGKAVAAPNFPLCQPPQVGIGNGAIGLCFDNSTPPKPNFPANNPDGNTSPEDGHCYITKQTGFGYAYFNYGPAPKYGCDQGPFQDVQRVTCNDGSNYVITKTNDPKANEDAAKATCAKHGSTGTGLAIDCNAEVLTRDNCGIIWYLQLFINVLSGLVGVVIVIVIIIAGIQWTTAGNNPQQLAHARTRIFNALIAMLLFIFMYAFLQWVVPGGIF